MIKKIVFSFLFFTTISVFSQQEKLNNYKYVIVPEKFDFVKSVDQYQTSSLTKFLLKKSGFEVFLGNEKLPNELLLNRCKALVGTVINDSNMFTVKSQIEFKDCNGTVIYTTEVGKSKEKDYKKGHQEAIRRAYETMANIDYSYKPATVVKNEVEALEPVIVEEVTTEAVTQKAVTENAVVAVKKESKSVTSNTLDVLYAQPTNNGFQLINLKPEIIFVILKTNKKDVYVIKGKDGTLYKNGDNWMAEYYNNDQLVKKEYQIKF